MSANPIAGMGGGAEGNHVTSNLGRGGWSVMGGGADLLLIFCDVVTNSSIQSHFNRLLPSLVPHTKFNFTSL